MTPILVGPILAHRGYFAWAYTTSDGCLRRSRLFMEKSAGHAARRLHANHQTRSGFVVVMSDDEINFALLLCEHRIVLPAPRRTADAPPFPALPRTCIGRRSS
jgi:hypothetical protein